MPFPELATIDTFTTWSDFAALRSEWTALWHDCEFATPFQAPEWLMPWARRWAADSLHVVTVRQAGTLIGLAPFFIYTQPSSEERTVVFLGNGLSDTLDLLAAPGCEVSAASAVMTAMEEQTDAWDTCDWQQLRADSPLLTQPAPVTWVESIELQDAWPTLALAEGQSIATVISPHFARRLQADRLRLERLGEVRFERTTADNFDAHFDSLIRLHTARWSSRDDQPGVLADPDVQRFHREAAAGLLARGVLRGYRLLVGDHVAAVYHGFHHRGRASYYLGGFDPALGSFGVGNQIVWHALCSAQEEGARVFDFLRGRETYKYRWGAVDSPALRRRLAHNVPTL